MSPSPKEKNPCESSETDHSITQKLETTGNRYKMMAQLDQNCLTLYETGSRIT